MGIKMEIAFRMISAILKSVAGDAFGSGLQEELIGISIDSLSEKGINRIIAFIKKGKSRIERILSRENMRAMKIPEEHIDYVVSEIKDLFSKTEITDEVIRQCEFDEKNLGAFLWKEYCGSRAGYIECEREIKQCLFVVADNLMELVTEDKNFETKLLISVNSAVDDANAEVRKAFQYIQENFNKLDADGQTVLEILRAILEQTEKMNARGSTWENTIVTDRVWKDKKEDYVRKWNDRLFLHFDETENPITLSKAFIMPDYKIHAQISRIGFSRNDTLDNIIYKFISYDKTSTMLITGVPGIGKSSITAWIANVCRADGRILILRFRDWNREALNKGLLNAICDKLGCKKEELEGKVLILDGFDEIKALDIRQDLLNDFLNEMKDFDNFKCMITSRPAYIPSGYFENVLVLKAFDIDKVDAFCKIITGNGLENREKIAANLEVLGIPVILYMAVMSDVEISKNPTKPELYTKIFAPKGGIFDKFSYEGNEYDIGNQILRDSENIDKFLNFLQETAFQMFETGSSALKKSMCEIPKLKAQGQFIDVLDFPIRHLFENNTDSIEFIHNSVYEYFVSEHIYSTLYKAVITHESPEPLEKVLRNLLKSRIVTPEILEFLRFRIKNSRLKEEAQEIYETFEFLLCFGMTCPVNEQSANVIDTEMIIFTNMLEILHLWNRDIWEFDELIIKYLKYNYRYSLNLRKAGMKKMPVTDLSGVYLESAHLEGANLEGAYLERANLKEAHLENINLKHADLERADFSYKKDVSKNKKGANLFQANLEGANLNSASLLKVNLNRANLKRAVLYKADLREADLRGAVLCGAKFDATDLRGADLRGADLGGTDLSKALFQDAIINESQISYFKKRCDIQGVNIFLGKTKKYIKYEEYQKRKG